MNLQPTILQMRSHLLQAGFLLEAGGDFGDLHPRYPPGTMKDGKNVGGKFMEKGGAGGGSVSTLSVKEKRPSPAGSKQLPNAWAEFPGSEKINALVSTVIEQDKSLQEPYKKLVNESKTLFVKEQAEALEIAGHKVTGQDYKNLFLASRGMSVAVNLVLAVGCEVAIGLAVGEALPAIALAAITGLGIQAIAEGVSRALKTDNMVVKLGIALVAGSLTRDFMKTVFKGGIKAILKHSAVDLRKKGSEALIKNSKVITQEGLDKAMVRESKALKDAGFETLEKLEEELVKLRKQPAVQIIEDTINHAKLKKLPSVYESANKVMENGLSESERVTVKRFRELSSLNAKASVLKRTKEIALYRPKSIRFQWRQQVIEQEIKHGEQLDAIAKASKNSIEKAFKRFISTLKRENSGDPGQIKEATPEQRTQLMNFLKQGIGTNLNKYQGVPSQAVIPKQVYTEIAEITKTPPKVLLTTAPVNNSFALDKATIEKVPKLIQKMGKTDGLAQSMGDSDGFLVVGKLDPVDRWNHNLNGLKLTANESERAAAFHEIGHLLESKTQTAKRTGAMIIERVAESNQLGALHQEYSSVLYKTPIWRKVVMTESTSVAAENLASPRMLQHYLNADRESFLHFLSVISQGAP